MIDERACARAFETAAGRPRRSAPPALPPAPAPLPVAPPVAPAVPRPAKRRRRASYAGVAACVTGVALACAGVVRTERPAEVAASVPLVVDAPDAPPAAPPDPPVPDAPVARAAPVPRSAAAAPKPPAPVVPVTLAVPAAGVHTSLERLGLDTHGELGVPRDYDRAGWWAGGRPGAVAAPAVFVGHVDSSSGPAVFYRVPGLRPGDEVAVSDAAGRTLTFFVYRVERYPKSRFPTGRVYGATTAPELRLITCGGAFDERTRHYRDNVVVFARLMAAPAP